MGQGSNRAELLSRNSRKGKENHIISHIIIFNEVENKFGNFIQSFNLSYLILFYSHLFDLNFVSQTSRHNYLR